MHNYLSHSLSLFEYRKNVLKATFGLCPASTEIFFYSENAFQITRISDIIKQES